MNESYNNENSIEKQNIIEDNLEEKKEDLNNIQDTENINTELSKSLNTETNNDNVENNKIFSINTNKFKDNENNNMYENEEKKVIMIPNIKTDDIDKLTLKNEDDVINKSLKKVQINDADYDLGSENYINDTDSEENEAEHQAEKINELDEDEDNDNNNEKNNNEYGLNVDLSKSYRKPYLGGYRNKITKIEYFHASTQTTTPQEKRAMGYGPRFHRDTQTHFWKNRYSQSVRDHATQMTKPGCYISSIKDKIIYPKKYITAEEHLNFITKNVIKIQCFFRKCKAIRI